MEIRIILCMKSKFSFERIKNQFLDKRIEWEEFIEELEDLQEKIVLNSYDIAIIDEKIWWKDDAINLLERKESNIILFQGDFEEVFKKILEFLPPEEKEEEKEVLNFSTDKEKSEDTREIRYIETEKVIVKEVIKKVPVYKEVYADISKMLISVVNLSERAGSTFITLNIAKALSEINVLTSVIEPPIKNKKPYIFDAIGLEQRLNKTDDEESLEFYSYPHEILEGKKIIRDKETIEEGIAWIVADARKPVINEWNYFKMMKLLYSSKKAGISILDIGSGIEEEYMLEILEESDLILVVVDPMPVEIMQNFDLLERFLELKRKKLPVQFLINKWTNGVNKKEFLKATNITPLTYINNVNLAYIHECYYNYEIPYSHPLVKKELQEPITKILSLFISKQLLFKNTEEKNHKNFSILNKINFFKRKDDDID